VQHGGSIREEIFDRRNRLWRQGVVEKVDKTLLMLLCRRLACGQDVQLLHENSLATNK
jgi:hypothetical protein